MGEILRWLSRKVQYPLIPPEIIQVSLTYRCNLKCRMCSIYNLSSQDEELSTQQVLHIIDEAGSYKIKEILFTGGEPFLREDIFKICRYSFAKGLRSIITTNGVLIDNNVALDIADSGVSHMHFSLDGLEETNDFFRGSGVFKKIIDAIDILNTKRKNQGSCSTGIACTVMDRNVKELFEIAKLADNLNVDSINFQPLVKNNANFLDKTLPDFWIKDEDIHILEEEIKKIRKYNFKHLTIYEEPSLNLLIKYYKRELSKKDWVCFGGFKTVFICFSKKQPLVYSCHGVCGDLDNTSLKKAWTSREAHKLRIHSRDCKDLCLQSCYSQGAAQSLINLTKGLLQRRKYG